VKDLQVIDGPQQQQQQPQPPQFHPQQQQVKSATGSQASNLAAVTPTVPSPRHSIPHIQRYRRA
jgi:hypothetical protein